MKFFSKMVAFPTGAYRVIVLAIILQLCFLMPSTIDEELSINKQISPCRSLNRLWKRDGTCGSCIQWYTSQHINGNNECHPLANITVPLEEHHAFIPNGMTVIMICEFSIDVTCSWKRGDSNICIDQKYSYIGAGNGSDTKDCSLQIVNFGGLDVDDWVCRSKATSNSDDQFGTQVHLSNATMIMAKNNTSTYMELEESIVLICYYEKPVDCVWHRNDDPVEINTRYSYIGKNSSGCNTRDCSIKIEKLKEIDMTTWRCQTTATSEVNATARFTTYDLSTVTPTATRPDTKLIPSKPNIFISNPSNPNDHGDNIICFSKHNVALIWKLDGKEIPATTGGKMNDANNDLYNFMIALNLTAEKYPNARLLKCIAKYPQGDFSDQINVASKKHEMNNGPPYDSPKDLDNSANSFQSTRLVAFLITVTSVVYLVFDL